MITSMKRTSIYMICMYLSVCLFVGMHDYMYLPTCLSLCLCLFLFRCDIESGIEAHLVSHTYWNQLVLMTCQPYQGSFSICWSKNWRGACIYTQHLHILSSSSSSFPSPFPPPLLSLLILFLFFLESYCYNVYLIWNLGGTSPTPICWLAYNRWKTYGFLVALLSAFLLVLLFFVFITCTWRLN